MSAEDRDYLRGFSDAGSSFRVITLRADTYWLLNAFDMKAHAARMVQGADGAWHRGHRDGVLSAWGF